MLEWLSLLSAWVQPMFSLLGFPERWVEDEDARAQIRRKATATYVQVLDVMGQRLAGGGPWAAGTSFTSPACRHRSRARRNSPVTTTSTSSVHRAVATCG